MSARSWRSVFAPAGRLVSRTAGPACAVCPGCVATYAKVLSVLGVGIALSETQQLLLLLGCIVLALGFGGRELRVTRRYGPMIITSVGCAVLVAVHVFGEDAGMAGLSWIGVALLLGGAAWGNRARLGQRSVHHEGPAASRHHTHSFDAEPAS